MTLSCLADSLLPSSSSRTSGVCMGFPPESDKQQSWGYMLQSQWKCVDDVKSTGVCCSGTMPAQHCRYFGEIYKGNNVPRLRVGMMVRIGKGGLLRKSTMNHILPRSFQTSASSSVVESLWFAICRTLCTACPSQVSLTWISPRFSNIC